MYIYCTLEILSLERKIVSDNSIRGYYGKVKTADKQLLSHQNVREELIHHLRRATAVHLRTLSVPGVGHSQFHRGPGVVHLRTPGRPLGI